MFLRMSEMTCLAASASLVKLSSEVETNFFTVSGKVIAQGEKEDNGQMVRLKS